MWLPIQSKHCLSAQASRSQQPVERMPSRKPGVPGDPKTTQGMNAPDLRDQEGKAQPSRCRTELQLLQGLLPAQSHL